MRNTTYKTGAQSKISVKKYNPLPTTPREHIDVGAVADADFKLCRSLLDGNKLYRKVESSSSETKIVRNGEENLKIFQSRPEKVTNGLSVFALEGKIEQRI